MSLSREETLKLAEIDTELANLLPSIKIPQFDYSDPPKAIAQLRASQASYNPTDTDPAVTETSVQYTTRDGANLRILVHSPSNPPISSPAPLIVLFHGGGCTIGSPENMTRIARHFVTAFSAVVVAPQYRLAPEHPFPYQAHDTWDTVRWLAGNAESIGADPRAGGFVVGGQSAGAKLATVVSHLARDEKLEPPLTGTWLAAGSVLSANVVPERYKDMYLSMTQEECLNAPVLDRQFAKLTSEALKADIYSALFVPFNWPTGHGGLPRTYFDVCGLDLVRDDSLIYERVLREEYGVETRMTVYPGMPHLFWSYFSGLKQTERWSQQTMIGMGWLLRKNVGQ
ncbi:MAG: hypothetical protein Q9227_000314 [Pyrenula ochraceoflavens]